VAIVAELVFLIGKTIQNASAAMFNRRIAFARRRGKRRDGRPPGQVPLTKEL
jgi:hypothetical protein